MGLPRSQQEPLAAMVRHERLREPCEGASVSREEAGCPGLGRRGRARKGGDDALAVELEDSFLLAAHEIDVELADADGGELAKLCDVLVDLARHAETVDGFVV